LSWIWAEDTGHKKLEKEAMCRRGWRGYVQKAKARNGGCCTVLEEETQFSIC